MVVGRHKSCQMCIRSKCSLAERGPRRRFRLEIAGVTVANAVVEATLAGIAANLDAVAAHTVIPDAIVEFVSKRVAAPQSGTPAGRAERPRRAPRFRYNSGL